MLAICQAFGLDISMYVPEYRDREEVVRTTIDAEGIFPGVDLAQVVRAAGNAAFFEDLILTPGVSANNQDGPRSAIYTIADFSRGIDVTGGRAYLDADEESIEADKLTIEASVKDFLCGQEVLDLGTFALANNITTVCAFPGRRDPLMNAGVELRVAPNKDTYVALLIPTYFRLAPKVIAQYLTNMRRLGRDETNPNLMDLAYPNGTTKVARLLALSAVCGVLDGYAEVEQLETQFKTD